MIIIIMAIAFYRGSELLKKENEEKKEKQKEKKEILEKEEKNKDIDNEKTKLKNE